MDPLVKFFIQRPGKSEEQISDIEYYNWMFGMNLLGENNRPVLKTREFMASYRFRCEICPGFDYHPPEMKYADDEAGERVIERIIRRFRRAKYRRNNRA